MAGFAIASTHDSGLTIITSKLNIHKKCQNDNNVWHKIRNLRR